MEGRSEDNGSENLMFESSVLHGRAEDARPPGRRSGPTWRAWLISIVAAIVLSVGAMLLLGGSFRLRAAGVSPGGCGPAANCCPPTDAGK